MAEAFHREAATDGQSFARTATGIHRVLPAAVAQYARLGRSVAAGHAAHAGEHVDLARGATRSAATNPVRVAAARRTRTVAE